MKCFDVDNPNGGFASAHDLRCFRGIIAPEVHMRATHHVRSGAGCMNVCEACSRLFVNRKDKDVEVAPLVTEAHL